MKIRTQLNISIAFFGVILLITSASVTTTSRKVERLNKQGMLAKNIELKVSELSYLSSDYILYRESQQIHRWESKYASISDDVSNLILDKPDQQQLINNIKANQQRLKKIFDDVVLKADNASETRLNTMNPTFIQVSWSRIGVQTQGIIFDASRLAHKLHDEVEDLQQINTLLILALLGTFIAFLLTNYLLFFRRTLKSISELQAGTRIIGAGNLDYTIKVKKGDEIGQLAQAFNHMTANLKIVTASKTDLEREITERKQAEETLQVKQEELTAANEEMQEQQDELFITYLELQSQAEEIRQQVEATARARDEAERRAAELDATISSIAAGVIIFDASGHIIRINEFARNMLGYSSDDYNLPYQKRLEKIKTSKSNGIPYEKEEEPLYRALRGEVIRDEEMIIAKVPEKPVWLSTTFAPIYGNKDKLMGVILIFTDISEQKRKAEDRLASERELLKVTLNSLGEGVVATDQEGHIIFINEATANLTGYSVDEATGEPLNKILNVLDDQTSEPIIVRASQKIFKGPILVTRDLRKVPIAINSSPIKVTSGQIIGTVVVFQDISEKQKIEQELLKAEKLESLGILAGGIAHDFNNVLAAILGNIQLALIKLEKNENIKKYLLHTVETTRKASELTKQLLTFSRGGAPIKKNASLIELIKDTADFALRGAKTKSEFAIPNDLWVASIDEGQISQVLHNLVINAKQAMPKGGIIYISAENITIGKDAGEHVRFNPGSYVKITVKDQGFGIAKENLSKIFYPFFTTKNDGNGLGLATSYSIIMRHNGYIEVESQESIGTTFFIYLPASNEAVLEVESQKEVAAAGAGLKILLMDDEEKILHAVGEMLECYGHQVVLTTDGAKVIECYQQAQKLREPFDVVIMDLTIPGGMGGQEAITHLWDIDPKVKAIVSSGYANDPIMSEYERFGFCGVVTKPYKFDELNEVLNRVIKSKQLSLELSME